MARVQLLAGVIACTSALFPALAQAQNTAESPPPDQSKPAQGEPSTPENTGNIAESPPPDSEDAAGQNTAGGESASVPPDQGQAQPGAANAAEGRPVGGGVENRAEGSLERGAGTPDTGLRTPDSGLGSEVAEPPVPDFTLPSPTELAGPVEGYEAPGIKLNIVELEPLPARPPADTFVQPERHYLKDRPLPPLDVDETERERLARSIEESLKLLDLSRENRPEEGIRIPLPSGVLTFKASDAFQFDRRNGILTFTGNAEIIFGDIAIWADLIEVDDGAATAYAKGYVGVQQGDEVIYCDEAYVNYDTDTFELFYVDGNTGGPRLSGTLYFKAERAYGTFDRMILEKAEITTCAPLCGSVDEFHLSAHKVVYKSGSSIVLHDVYIYIRSHKVGYIPLLAFPLTRDRRYEPGESEIQQVYGYNRSEGWFAKFAYTYSARYTEGVSKALLGVVKIDLSERQGPGLGVRQDFFIPSLGVATLRAFYQQQWPAATRGIYLHPFQFPPSAGLISQGEDGASTPTNFDFFLEQELNLSRELRGKLKVDRKNTFVPAAFVGGVVAGQERRSDTWNNSLNLNYNRGSTTTSLTGSHNISTTGSTGGAQQLSQQIVNTNANFSFNRDLSSELKFTLTENYTSNSGRQPGIPADQEGTRRMQLNFTPGRDSPLAGYNVKLAYLNQGIDYDGDRNVTDRNRQIRKEQPSFELTLPRDLINDGAYFTNFTINVDNLVTGPRSKPQSATRMKIAAGGRERLQFSRSSSLDTSVNLAQYWYDDGNAQYMVQPRLVYKYDPFDWWIFNAGWNLTYRQGVVLPPVQGDQTRYRQSLTYSATFTNHRSWRWKLSSGLDLRHSVIRLPDGSEGSRFYSPNPLSSTFTWDPNRTFSFTHSFTYNLLKKDWNPTRMAFTFRSPYVNPQGYYNWLLGTTLDINTDYSENARTSRFDIRYFKLFKRGWSSDITASYRDPGEGNVPSDTLSFLEEYVKKVVVRKVNCCTTIEGTWRTGINEVYLQVYLNALPQYPGAVNLTRPFDDEADAEFFFPTNTVFNDIQTDVFGISQGLF